MTSQIEAASASVRAEPRWHFPRGRAWMLVSILPLWIVAFLLLQLVAGTDGPPPAPKTLAEAVDQYADVSTPGWIVWTLYASGIMALTSLVVLWLGRSVRGLRGGGAAAWLSTAALVCGLIDSVVSAYVVIGLKISDPPSYPPLIERFGLAIENSKVWVNPLVCGLWAAAIGVVATILWRERLLGRTALVVAVMAGVFLLITLFVPVPLFAAVLLIVLGIALVRFRHARSA